LFHKNHQKVGTKMAQGWLCQKFTRRNFLSNNIIEIPQFGIRTPYSENLTPSTISVETSYTICGILHDKPEERPAHTIIRNEYMILIPMHRMRHSVSDMNTKQKIRTVMHVKCTVEGVQIFNEDCYLLDPKKKHVIIHGQRRRTLDGDEFDMPIIETGTKRSKDDISSREDEDPDYKDEGEETIENEEHDEMDAVPEDPKEKTLDTSYKNGEYWVDPKGVKRIKRKHMNGNGIPSTSSMPDLDSSPRPPPRSISNDSDLQINKEDLEEIRMCLKCHAALLKSQKECDKCELERLEKLNEEKKRKLSVALVPCVKQRLTVNLPKIAKLKAAIALCDERLNQVLRDNNMEPPK